MNTVGKIKANVCKLFYESGSSSSAKTNVLINSLIKSLFDMDDCMYYVVIAVVHRFGIYLCNTVRDILKAALKN